MSKKPGPIFLLGTLIVILVFMVGVKYGKRVESSNKTIDFALSIAPTKTPTPTVPISFQTFKNEGCGVQFLYPESLKVDKNSSAEASLKEGKAEAVQLSCAKTNTIQKILTDTKIATEEVMFKTQTLKARTDKADLSHTLYFQIKNPLNGASIYVGIAKNFYPLFENTLQYLP